MDSNELLRLVNLLQQESAARAGDKAELMQIITGLNVTIQQLNETIGRLLEENRLLKTPKKDSRNSSVPPSKDENRPKKTISLRQSSGKRPGGQSGHGGSTLKMASIPDVIIEHRPSCCNYCGLALEMADAQLVCRRQVIDIPPIKPVFTEHRQYRSLCPCGHQTVGMFPLGVNAPVSYGNHAEALIAYLHTRQYIPFARTSEFFASVCNMPISQGAVCAILQRFSLKAEPAYRLIKEAVKESKVIGADETGMKENGKLGWFWAWQSKVATFISYSASRGAIAIQANFPTGFPDAILVHDCWKSQLNTPALGHQLCVAHLLRELLFFEQKYSSGWASGFKGMLYRALELKKTTPADAYGGALKERAELEAKLQQLLEEKIPEKQVEVITFQKRIIKYREHLFTFLYHPEVPPDNNASERAIRNIKVKQKVSGMFKSAKGAQIYATIRSITDTCIKNGNGILDAFMTIAKLQPE
jgi:transposase